MHNLILKGLDVSKAQAEILSNPDLWKIIQVRQNYPNSVHKDTETIYIRRPVEFTKEGIKDSIQSVTSRIALDTLPECVKIAKQVAEMITFKEVGRIVVINLKAGKSIERHSDTGPYASYYTRYHIPIKTNDQVISYSANDQVNMKEGELWLYPHKTDHWVENNGDTDRWHLVMDLRA